ncbi:MAG: hypothetical protein ABJA69_11400 [Acidobacteriaceae bacterium]
MDSRQRQHVTRKILEITKDPEAAQIAKAVLCGTEAARKKPTEGITRKEFVFLLLPAAMAIVIFMFRRTPVAVLAGTALVSACLVHPTLYLPYIMGISSEGRLKRIFVLLTTAALVFSLGYLAWRDAVKERADDVAKSLTPITSVNSQLPFDSAFTISNDSGFNIVSERMYCRVIEAFGDHDISVGEIDTGFFPDPVPIKAGKDVRSTQCLEPIKNYMAGNTLRCADVILEFDYRMDSFPHLRDTREYRFVVRRIGSNYESVRASISDVHGMCSGLPLPWLKKSS